MADFIGEWVSDKEYWENPNPAQWTDYIDLAIADLRSKNRSPFEQRAYDVLRSMFGTDTAQK